MAILDTGLTGGEGPHLLLGGQHGSTQENPFSQSKWLQPVASSRYGPPWESGRAQALAAAAGQARPEVSLPVGFTTFPGEIFRAPRSWVEKGYPALAYFHEAGQGGHFAAWEEPELFATESGQRSDRYVNSSHARI
jgi:hypothetical protein